MAASVVAHRLCTRSARVQNACRNATQFTQEDRHHEPQRSRRRAEFRALHAQGCFVLPNPWDGGTARMLQGLGFKALATTSSGFAWS
jgi:hypothetical protein